MKQLKTITLVLAVQKSQGSNTDHCTMSGPHHSHTTGKPWSHSKASWPRGPMGGFKQVLGCSYHEGLQTKDLSAREAVFSHVAFHA